RGGGGCVVLSRLPADTRWSDLPLSGTFVEMLKRIVSFAGSVAATDATGTSARSSHEVLPPTRILDGFGLAGPPPTTARAVPANFSGRATFDHPPGLYGPPEGLLAVHALAPDARLAPPRLSPLPGRAPRSRRGAYAARPAGAARARRGRGLRARRRHRAARAPAAAGGERARDRNSRRGAVGVAAGVRAEQRRAGLAIDARAPPRLRHHRRRRGRPHQQGRAPGPHLVPRATHRARAGRADRARSRARRACLLSADLLADRAERGQAEPRGARTHRRLHEAGRHRPVRHPRRCRGARRRRRRNPRSGHAGAARHSLLARYSRARAGAARPRADEDILSPEGLSRPLQLRPAVGGSAACR